MSGDMKDSNLAKCFICDEQVAEIHECLLKAYTKYTKVSVPTKISGIVGDDFVVVVKNDDTLCQRCNKLVNEMDRLDMELTQIKKILSSYLLKTYNISDEIGNGEIDSALPDNTAGAPSEEENLKCSTGSVSFTFADFKVHPNKNLLEESSEEIHVDSTHESKNNCICSACFGTFADENECKQHLKKCPGSKKTGREITENLVHDICLSCRETQGSDTNSSNYTQNVPNKEVKKYIPQENHISFDNKVTIYICRVCKKQQYKRDEVIKHFGKIQVLNYFCHVCGEGILDEIELEAHTKTHESEEIVTKSDNILAISESDVGDSERKDKSQSIESMMIISTNQENEKQMIINEDSIIMEQPITNFSKKSEDNDHAECLDFQSLKENYICAICGHLNDTEKDLLSHMSVHENTETVVELSYKNCINDNDIGKTNYLDDPKINAACKCSFCKKDFSSVLKLKEHEVRHFAKLQPSQCEYCLENLCTPQNLIDHILKSHNEIKQTLICPLCKRKSPTKYSLKRHVLRCHLVKRLQKEVREKYADGLDLNEKCGINGNELVNCCEVNNASDTDNSQEEDSIKESECDGQENKFVCTVCALICSGIDAMREHIKCHSIEKISCPICKKTFRSHDSFTEHVKIIHSKILEPNQCPHCFVFCSNQSDDIISNLDKHLKQVHRDMYENLICSECDCLFHDVSSLKDHVQNSHYSREQYQELVGGENVLQELALLGPNDALEIVINTEYTFDEVLADALQNIEVINDSNETINNGQRKKQYHTEEKIEGQEPLLSCEKICNICNRKCRSKLSLDKHLKTHSPDFKNVTCIYCPAKLHDNSHLRTHMQLEHPGKNQPYCSQCDRYFSQRAAYLRHKSTNHAVDKICPKCGKQFSVMKRFIFHVEYCHREELKCQFCNKKFGDPKKLKIHEYVHKRNEGKVFECDFCRKTFKTGSGLRFHKLMHTGNYPFFCEYCGRGFASKHQLDEHIAKHTGEERFVCDVCGKRFQLYDTYHRHRNLHDNPYPKQCDICKKFFRNASRVAEHKRKIHTGERPYKCPFCPMTFNISSTYKVHLCIHTQKFPHNCKLCSRGFTTRIKYANHLASKHEDYSLLNDKKPNYKQVFPDGI